jgi:hypothetical protein
LLSSNARWLLPSGDGLPIRNQHTAPPIHTFVLYSL